MNILSMLTRLEHALGCSDLSKQMVLLPSSTPKQSISTSNIDARRQEINLVVGYDGSPGSQTALDLTLWIAHQTRLATAKPVTVQVVYVVNLTDECNLNVPPISGRRKGMTKGLGKGIADDRKGLSSDRKNTRAQAANLSRRSTANASSAVAELTQLESSSLDTLQSCQTNQFDQADRILWQARNLAEEWRGSLKTHLRFGRVADELRQVVEAESASLLLLGCQSAEAAVVKELGSLPCPVLGIPAAL